MKFWKHKYLLFLLLMLVMGSCNGQNNKRETHLVPDTQIRKSMKFNELNDEEKRVIIGKGTERAFTGAYTDNERKGTYICRQCNALLYKSESKFHSGCGWPSFDEEIQGAVRKTLDADGRRTEITCNNCGGHLGHVFYGEGFTDKNIRHCVNSISMIFVEDSLKKQIDTAIFAGGCFWGVEYYFQNAKGVINTNVGYTGGTKANPTYQEVCRHQTGHYEAIEVVFDPSLTSFEELARLFFEIHDPTQADGQGNDIGDQYLSVVFYRDEDQKATSIRLIEILTKKGFKIVTRLKPATTFWLAEDYHQQYYEKGGGTPYCHSRVARF